ncbi:hypothetical protein MNB_SUP05-7-174 [hydrothermal vent metagenome]|uniref:Uncharacterized protein n=1 Tax=hydrothermal vent metagenome TaxID=652676 RepID=A0A1W1DQJ5_9ZZZZ
MVYQESADDRSSASKREYEIKNMSRSEKMTLYDANVANE